eukprot:13179414-Alexandrium_andersonii.AAC.1
MPRVGPPPSGALGPCSARTATKTRSSSTVRAECGSVGRQSGPAGSPRKRRPPSPARGPM